MDDAAIDAIMEKWWYYAVELAPGRFTTGPMTGLTLMLPRMLMRGVDLAGAECLDCGTMEGLMPTVMKRRGASRVLAVDAIDHCVDKIAAVKAAYGVEFDYARVGLMYELSRKLKDRGAYDLINLSGLLYHVFSPLHVLAGVRPLLKRNGLMVVSTNVVVRNDFTMEYNAAGRLQSEPNTFWYIAIPALEQMLHAVQLQPVDCLFWPMGTKPGASPAQGDFPVGYLSVICRAVEPAEVGDDWLRRARHLSWEFQALLDRPMMEAQPASSITYASERKLPPILPGALFARAISDPHQVVSPATTQDTNTLRLADDR